MSIEAKNEGLIRLGGSILILISAVISVLFDYYLLNFCALYHIVLAIIVAWIIFILCEKFEIDFVMEMYNFLLIFLCIYSIGLFLMGSLTCATRTLFLPFILLTVSNILIWICWHFSISIYKTKKKIFLISGTIYIIITLTVRIQLLVIEIEWIFAVISLILLIIGIILIIVAEKIMKKKGLLNYI